MKETPSYPVDGTEKQIPSRRQENHDLDLPEMALTLSRKNAC
jgi:hypothetical protein